MLLFAQLHWEVNDTLFFLLLVFSLRVISNGLNTVSDV